MNSHLQLKNRIKELRQEQGLSQTALAKMAVFSDSVFVRFNMYGIGL